MVWLKSSEISKLAGVSERAIRMVAETSKAKKEWRGAQVEIREVAGMGRGGKSYEFLLESLPMDLQKKYAKSQAKELPESVEKVVPIQAPDKNSLWSGFEIKPDSIKEEAKKKLRILNELEDFLAAGLGEVRDFAKNQDVTAATIYRWKQKLKGVDKSDWLPVLADNYTGGLPTADISPVAWDFFKTCYLNRAKKHAATAFKYTVIAARENGWTLPSYRTVLRKLQRDVPNDVVRAMREGNDAVKEMMPKIRRTTEWMRALELINGDGLDPKLTFGVVFTNDGEIVPHPKIWIWQDVYSGMILGFQLAKSENRDMIRTSLGEVIEKYGIPSAVLLDNTRAAANKELSGGISHRYRFKVKEEDADGILKILGIQVHWATPGQGWVKPIERKNRDLNALIPSHPIVLNAMAEKRPVTDIELSKVIETAVEEINSDIKCRSMICGGVRSPQQVFNESHQKQLITRLSKEQRRLFLLAAEGVSVRKDGYIAFYENLYWNATLANHRGEKVIVRFDANELKKAVAVYMTDGRFICEADYQPSIGFQDREGARNAKRMQKNYKDSLKKTAELQVKMDTALASKLMPETQKPAPIPQTNVVKGHFRKEKREENEPVKATGTDGKSYADVFSANLARLKAEKAKKPVI